VWIDGRRGIRCAMIGTRAVHAGPGWTAARRPVRFYTAAVIVTRSAAQVVQISVRILNPQQESRRGERVGTPLPLLKCLKGIMDGVANHFPVTNALDCRSLYIQSQKFSGVISPDSRRSASVLRPRHQFPLGSPLFPLFLFYEMPTDWQLRKHIKVKSNVNTYTAPQVNELDCSSAVRHRQETAFILGRSPCPHTRTLQWTRRPCSDSAIIYCSPSLQYNVLHPRGFSTHLPTPRGMEGRVGLQLVDPERTVYRVVTCQPQIGRRSGKVRRPETDVLTIELRRRAANSRNNRCEKVYPFNVQLCILSTYPHEFHYI